MTDTYCKICAFNNDQNECHFNIPEYLDKDIQEKDGFRLIKDYRCLYGTSKDSITNESTLENLINYTLVKNHIRYYLFINLTDDTSDNISYMVNIINKLDIKPKFVSFLLKLKQQSHKTAEEIKASLDPQIKWKMHNFLGNDTVNHCTYVNIATNMNANGSNCIVFFKPNNSEHDNLLNDKINFVQFSQLVKQENAHIIAESLDSLSGMCMPFILYKDFVDNSDRDIVLGIKKILDKNEPLKVLLYDYKSNDKD